MSPPLFYTDGICCQQWQDSGWHFPFLACWFRANLNIWLKLPFTSSTILPALCQNIYSFMPKCQFFFFFFYNNQVDCTYNLREWNSHMIRKHKKRFLPWMCWRSWSLLWKCACVRVNWNKCELCPIQLCFLSMNKYEKNSISLKRDMASIASFK